jgi:glycerate 2-kinase
LNDRKADASVWHESHMSPRALDRARVDRMSREDARHLLASIFADAVASVRGDRLIAAVSRLEGGRWICRAPDREVEIDLPADGRILVVGAGKAAASLAKGLEHQFSERIAGGCIIVKYGHTEALERIEQIEAGHPVPDSNGLAGTARLLAMLDGLQPEDRVFVLLTGGASALLVAPVDGVTLSDKAAVTQALLRSNASIDEINTVRKALSRIKGGRLAERISPAQLITLLISDVPSGDIATIGSGPTVCEPLTGADALDVLERHGILGQTPQSVVRHLAQQRERGPAPPCASAQGETVVLATSAALVRKVDAAAAQAGLPVVHVDLAMAGGTHDAARAFARAMKAHLAQGNQRPCLFVSAGETTLQVSGSGLGGRNQEFALIAAQELTGEEALLVLASGTDGTDGPTEAAGGFADGTTCQRAADRGLAINQALAINDSHTILRTLGDLHVTGPTGTNVMDLVLGLAF